MDAPDTIQPAQPQPAITDPQMDTNRIYEQEHERPQQISDNQPIQLAQNDVPTMPTLDTHHIVQAPDGAKVAFPKGTPPDTMHQEMTKWWQPHLQRTVAAWDSVRNAASNAAQAIGLPSDMPEWQKASDEFVRDPIGTTGDVVGAIIGGLAHGANAVIPSTPENNAMISRAQAEYAQGNHLAAAVTLTPLVGDGLAKAVKQAQARDYSGSLGTATGVVAPFLTESFKGEGELPITREKPVQPTTTSYEHTPDQTGQFGNYEHVVTTKNAEGKTVGHLAAQDTAPGEVTIRSNQIYDEAHRGQGKGTAAIRTLVNETAKNPELKTIHSDITTTGAARGAWEKIADANPDTVTKQDFNGVPRWSVDLDKVREKAANAPEFNGEERRGAARGPLMKATDIENNLKTGQPVTTPFDNTEGAMDTINRDLATRLEKPKSPTPAEDTAFFNKKEAEQAKPGAPVPKTSAAAAGRSVGAASINDLNTKEDVPTFYSKAEQVINDKVSNNASGDSIKALLKNNGVKDDEMKWSGLDEFLKDKPKVSKADLQQFIKENQIQLKDVDLGKTQRFTTRLNEAETDNSEPGRPVVDVIDPTNGLVRFTGDESAAQDYMAELGQGLSHAEEVELLTLRREGEQLRNNPSAVAQDHYRQNVLRQNELLRKQEQGVPTRPTKYDKWTVPGERENYQEKLLTLPTAAEEVTPERKAYNDYHDALMRKYGVDPRDFNPNTNARPEGYQARIDAARAKLLPEEVTRGRELHVAALNADDRADDKSGEYVAPHFQGGGPEGNVPNIVAHVRFDDRPAVDGKKTLFMEEAQSDWHSAGRHEGYRADPKAIAEAESNLKEAKARKTEFVQSVVDRINAAQEHKLAINPLSEQTSWQIRNAMTPEESAKFDTLNIAVNKAAVAKTELTQGAVPDAPFKQSWHELVMKRMLREAAEKGYDQLAWTTGDQQADLYDLSKHIGKIEYDPEQNKLRAFDPQGKKVLEENVDPTVKELTPYIGQEHAENLARQIEDYQPDSEPDTDSLYENAANTYEVRPIEPEGEDGETTYGLFADYQNEPIETYENERAAERGREHQIEIEVQHEVENYEPDPAELPAITNLNEHKGGEFHRLLYDKMIPSFLKKYAKKWGAEVGTTEIKGMGTPEVDYEGPNKTVQELQDVSDNGGVTGKHPPGYSAMRRLGDVLRAMRSGKPFRDAMLSVVGDTDAEHLAEHLGGKFIKTPANQKVHSIEITPAMRQSVMKEGQPIAKNDKKKKPFAAPQEPQVASNFRPSLAERMKNALS